ncbi:hypothetical protein SALBM311S_01698 [Streptomyces alboniger]
MVADLDHDVGSGVLTGGGEGQRLAPAGQQLPLHGEVVADVVGTGVVGLRARAQDDHAGVRVGVHAQVAVSHAELPSAS